MEHPPECFQVSATQLFLLSRAKGAEGLSSASVPPFPRERGEGDRTGRNCCFKSPSPFLGKGPGVRALFFKIFAGQHTSRSAILPAAAFSIADESSSSDPDARGSFAQAWWCIAA